MDYTDNQGWAKLDARSALQLADMISHFSETTKDARTRMLLFCFSRLSNSKLPAFSLGYRTIAKECNVSVRQVRGFIAYCEKYGYMEKIGTPKQGEYQKRAFTWMLDYLEEREQEGVPNSKRKRTEGCAQKRAQGVPFFKRKRTEGCALFQEEKDTHQSTEYSEKKYSRTSRAYAVRANALSDAQTEKPKPKHPSYEGFTKAEIEDLDLTEKIFGFDSSQYWDTYEGKLSSLQYRKEHGKA